MNLKVCATICQCQWIHLIFPATATPDYSTTTYDYPDTTLPVETVAVTTAAPSLAPTTPAPATTLPPLPTLQTQPSNLS